MEISCYLTSDSIIWLVREYFFVTDPDLKQMRPAETQPLEIKSPTTLKLRRTMAEEEGDILATELSDS